MLLRIEVDDAYARLTPQCRRVRLGLTEGARSGLGDSVFGIDLKFSFGENYYRLVFV